MTITIKSTKTLGHGHGIKALVYGQSGSGKTRLCATTGAPTLVISAEAGLLSLRDHDIDVVEVKSLDDVTNVHEFVTQSQDAKKYHWVCLDSLSELAEIVLADEKESCKDGRKAYMTMADKMSAIIRTFRDLPGKHVYMSAKIERVKDEYTETMLYTPAMPGAKFSSSIPFFFDEVFALRVEKNDEGEMVRWMQTASDIQYLAKDRSGALDAFERPDLKLITQKIFQTMKKEQPKNKQSKTEQSETKQPETKQAETEPQPKEKENENA